MTRFSDATLVTAPTMAEELARLPMTEVDIAQIDIGERLRPVSEAAVQALVHVIAEHGFTVPILLRKMRGQVRLIDGAHRLDAMRKMGASHIPAMMIECTSEEARALEASQNLAGASMSPLDDALFLAAYAQAYQTLHPETRRGAAGALARHGLANELFSFAEIIAEKRAITVRQVQKIAAAGRNITHQEAEHLRGAKRKVTLTDIVDIGKIGNEAERVQVVLSLAGGNAKTAAAARRLIKAEAGGVVVMNAKDAAFNALINAWRRAPISVRKRFCLEAAGEIWEAQNKGAPLTSPDEAADV